jgi:hypothetical protein
MSLEVATGPGVEGCAGKRWNYSYSKSLAELEYILHFLVFCS